MALVNSSIDLSSAADGMRMAQCSRQVKYG